MSWTDTSLVIAISAFVSFVVVVARDRYKEHQKQVEDTRAKLTRVITCLQAPHVITDWRNESDVGAGQLIGQAIGLGVAPELIELMRALRKVLGQCRLCCERTDQAACERCHIARWASDKGGDIQAYYDKLTPRIRVWRIKSPALWIERRSLSKTIDGLRQELDGLGASAPCAARPGA